MKYLILIIALTTLILIAGCSTPQSDPKVDTFAKCLTENGAKMFGAFWCPHCQDQKAEFGTAFQYIDYVECSTPDGKAQTEYCQQQGITGYPTWEFADASRQSGAVPMVDLAAKTGCTLPN